MRDSPWDGLFVLLSMAHAAVLLLAPSITVIAVGLWWNANTISHNFIHRPFFRSRRLNRSYAAGLSLLLGIPQTYWRERHLLHHAGLSRRVRWTHVMTVEAALVAGLWTWMFTLAPRFFLSVYAPGYLLGLGLCFLQGHYEHARGTTSFYGRLYNLFFFNDGYHVEHHRRPGESWRRLPARIEPGASTSRWPPVLRWMELFSLEALERLVLRSPALQRFVLTRHEHAFRRVLPLVRSPKHVKVVGGGLFPRTALLIRKLLPDAELTIVEANQTNIEIARQFLGARVHIDHAMFDSREPEDADLVIVPLCFMGDRRQLYKQPPAGAVLVHDWIWARRGKGAIVSWLLAKRLNLVTR